MNISSVLIGFLVQVVFLVCSVLIFQSSSFAKERRELAGLIGVSRKCPAIILSLFVTWVACAGTAIYFKFYFDWDPYGTPQVLLIVYLIILGWNAFIAANSIYILLNLKQLETSGRVRPAIALGQTPYYFIISFPIILIWSTLDFVITTLDSLLRRKNDDEDEAATMENFAQTLSGFEENQSIGIMTLRILLQMMAKALRMVSMLSLTAVVWREFGPFWSMGQALTIVKRHPGAFAKRFLLSWAVIFFIVLPPGLVCWVASKTHLHLPDGVWLGVIVYSGVAWSLMIYSEIILMAGLYMWNLKWLQVNRQRREEGKRPIWSIIDVKQPSFCDDVPDLLVRRNKSFEGKT